VVFAEIGGSAAADAVFDDADPIDVEPPDDRPARGARREARTGYARLGKQEIAKLSATLAADFLVRHHRHRCKLIGYDRQHALLRRGCGRRRLGLRRWRGRRGAVAVGDDAGDARQRSRRNDVSPHDRTWRGHRDSGKLGGRRRTGILRHCTATHSAQQQPTRTADLESPSRKKRHGHIPIKAAATSSSSTNLEALAVHVRRTDCNSPERIAAHEAANPMGSSSYRCQETGGARGWKATRAEFRWMNPASVVRYKTSIACGSNSSGGVANSIVFASARRAQIAQAPPGCWSESWLDAGCC
jgi:hypothetical protein